MADPLILNPTLTLAGQAAAFNASNTRIELIVDSVSFGLAHYDPDGTEVALVSPVGSRVPFAGGSRPTPYQLRISAAWKEDVGDVPIGEIAFWAGDTLAFVWSKANGQIASYKTNGVAYVMFADLAFAQVPANSITIVIDPDQSAALAALSEHEGAANAHPQYLLRADVAKDAGPLMGLKHSAGSAANALLLELDAPESALPTLAKFQRFQFVAASTNTTPVTVNIEGLGVKAVKRGGDTGLVDLDAGDIKAGSLYDLNYDGAVFQLGGGVGSGKAFERFSFTAAVAQSVFTFPHVPGSIIALRNGREVYDFASAADGSKVTLAIPCNVDDRMEFLAFKSFKVADSYTKAEVLELLKTSSGLPVGSMLPMPNATVPPGYLEVDGSVQSIAAYPDLAAYLGMIFNKGDEGAGNFRLPESRAEFLRGWDHGRGVDAGRAVGSYQVGTKVQGDDGVGPTVQGIANVAQIDADPAPGFAADINYTATGMQSGSFGTAYWRTVRPRNLAVMWCIKAWNAPVNQGQIDIAALAYLAAQASEQNQGTAKIATQSLTDAGADDATIVTPKKLRMGVSWNFGVNGWLALPSWLGGVIIQWGQQTAQVGTTIVTNTYAFPMAFPNQVFRILGYRSSELQNSNSITTDHFFAANVLNWSVVHVRSSGSLAIPFVYLAIGR
jgi:hypothetical protein